MASTPLKLSATQSVVLDASGNGSVQLGPTAIGETWIVRLTVVRVTTTTPDMPVCTIYEGPISDANMRDTTYNGGRNASDSVFHLGTSQFITVRWEGGVVGSTAVATVSGELELAGRRAY